MPDPRVAAETVLPSATGSTLVGRMWLPDAGGPRLVAAQLTATSSM